MNWKLPDDPEKPDCPYTATFALTVVEHQAYPPFGGGKYRGGPAAKPFEGYDTFNDYTQTRYCVRDLKPGDPTESSTDSSDSAPNQSLLVINSVRRGGDNAGAQVVVCRWGQDPDKTQYAAKIFDPLYYNFVQRDHPKPNDVIWQAECDYRVEAAPTRNYASTSASGKLPHFEINPRTSGTVTQPTMAPSLSRPSPHPMRRPTHAQYH